MIQDQLGFVGAGQMAEALAKVSHDATRTEVEEVEEEEEEEEANTFL